MTEPRVLMRMAAEGLTQSAISLMSVPLIIVQRGTQGKINTLG